MPNLSVTKDPSLNQDPVDYRRKWLILASVAMGVFLATIDGSIVNIALPSLVAELHTDFATVQWVVLAYLLINVTLMLGVGRLADMIGKKYLYTAGFIVFTILRVTRCGALAPATNTAPITRSAPLTSSSTLARLDITVVIWPPRISCR